MQMKSIRIVTVSTTGLVLLVLAGWAGYRIAPESSPVARGAAYAEVRGCVGCHGDPENPLTEINEATCSNANNMDGHPEYDVACADAMAYFETVRLRRTFDARMQANVTGSLMAGEKLVREYHCFQCHGHLGQGGFSNAKSFKGYVPGYFGADFKLLTNNGNPDSVRKWISQGVDPAIVAPPLTGWIAQYFLSREAVSMPAYSSLPPEEIETLVNYVIAINQFGPMDASTVRLYGELAGAAPK
jgi:mono/diheme cytochrome c family protein